MAQGGTARGGIGPAHLLAVALGAALLAGCDAAPLPETALLKPQPALLKPQPAPKCEAPREARGGGGARVASAEAGKAVAIDEAARLRKLDYEAQCYRHAEMIARRRLGRLQESVQDMARTAKAPPAEPPPPNPQ